MEQALRPENIEASRRKNEKEYGRLVLDRDGFRLLHDGKQRFDLQWSDVRTIRTFKRDFFAYDMICLAFEIGDDEWVEIWEGMVDFTNITDEMESRFPGIPSDWYSVVMLPAFATNERVLWQKGSSGQDPEGAGDSPPATDECGD